MKDVELIEKKYKNTYLEEYRMIDLMQATIKKRPKSMDQLKESVEYISWMKKIPEYIPLYFN